MCWSKCIIPHSMDKYWHNNQARHCIWWKKQNFLFVISVFTSSNDFVHDRFHSWNHLRLLFSPFYSMWIWYVSVGAAEYARRSSRTLHSIEIAHYSIHSICFENPSCSVYHKALCALAMCTLYSQSICNTANRKLL